MFNQHNPIATLCLLAFVSAVAVVDLRTRRIPNRLALTGAVCGLASNLASAGAPGALISGAGLLVGLAAFLPFYLLRGMGAGDVKAMAAIGAFVGAKGTLVAAGWTLVAGGIAALLIVATRWALPLLVSAAGGGAAGRRPTPDVRSRRFAYGLPIACGTIASLLSS